MRDSMLYAGFSSPVCALSFRLGVWGHHTSRWAFLRPLINILQKYSINWLVFKRPPKPTLLSRLLWRTRLLSSFLTLEVIFAVFFNIIGISISNCNTVTSSLHYRDNVEHKHWIRSSSPLTMMRKRCGVSARARKHYRHHLNGTRASLRSDFWWSQRGVHKLKRKLFLRSCFPSVYRTVLPHWGQKSKIKLSCFHLLATPWIIMISRM